MTNEQYIKYFIKSWKMDIRFQQDGSYTANDIIIRPENMEWIIEVQEMFRDSEGEPSYELVEVARECNFGKALTKVALLEFEWSICSGLEQLQEEILEHEFAEFCDNADKELFKSTHNEGAY